MMPQFASRLISTIIPAILVTRDRVRVEIREAVMVVTRDRVTVWIMGLVSEPIMDRVRFVISRHVP